MPTGVIFTLFHSSVDGDGLSSIVIATPGSFNKSGARIMGVITFELSALAALSFASSISGTGAGRDIVGVRASTAPVPMLCTGVADREPESAGFVNLDPLAAARLGMGGGSGAPVPGAGDVVRDGGPTCKGVPGRESGSAILSGSVEECRLWPDARGGMRGGAAWLVIDVVAGRAGEGTGEDADGGRASGCG